MADAPISVLVVDDHAVVREGLRTFLGLQDGLEVVGEAADGEEACAQAARLRPDVILMDLTMPRLDGVGAMRELRRRLPATRVVVLTSNVDDNRLLAAIQAGAAGYLLKSVQPQELARAVRAAHAGEALLDPSVAARLVEAIAAPAAPRPGRPADPPRAGGARADRRAGARTSGSPPSSASRRRRSRRTSATSSPSSGSPTARRRRCTPSARTAGRAGRGPRSNCRWRPRPAGA